MASEHTHVDSRLHRIGVMRLAATLGVGAALIFGIFWLGLFIPRSSPTPTSACSHLLSQRLALHC